VVSPLRPDLFNEIQNVIPFWSRFVRVLAAVSDLFFASKISAAAKQLGLSADFYSEEERLLAEAAKEPSIILVDLNDTKLDPIVLIRKLKATPLVASQAQIIAFLSHVQQARKREAEQAGCDLVLPRSVFSQNLEDLLRQRSCYN
jgi:CheY-like chemotaxis protein